MSGNFETLYSYDHHCRNVEHTANRRRISVGEAGVLKADLFGYRFHIRPRSHHIVLAHQPTSDDILHVSW